MTREGRSALLWMVLVIAFVALYEALLKDIDLGAVAWGVAQVVIAAAALFALAIYARVKLRAARNLRAISLLEAGKFEAAAREFEALAGAKRLRDRPVMLANAAWARLRNGEPEASLRAADEALACGALGEEALRTLHATRALAHLVAGDVEACLRALADAEEGQTRTFLNVALAQLLYGIAVDRLDDIDELVTGLVDVGGGQPGRGSHGLRVALLARAYLDERKGRPPLAAMGESYPGEFAWLATAPKFGDFLARVGLVKRDSAA